MNMQCFTFMLLFSSTVYWTSGRDLQEWGQFRWDGAENEHATYRIINDTAHEFFPSPPKYRTCVAFMIMKDGNSIRLTGLDCQNKYGVLCQSALMEASPETLRKGSVSE